MLISWKAMIIWPVMLCHGWITIGRRRELFADHRSASYMVTSTNTVPTRTIRVASFPRVAAALLGSVGSKAY
uniref:Putative secreted protein n=1 Tax=Anopheles darlingi TaxID=43151 RepID=A0A2M4DIA4_ANODA